MPTSIMSFLRRKIDPVRLNGARIGPVTFGYGVLAHCDTSSFDTRGWHSNAALILHISGEWNAEHELQKKINADPTACRMLFNVEHPLQPEDPIKKGHLICDEYVHFLR